MLSYLSFIFWLGKQRLQMIWKWVICLKQPNFSECMHTVMLLVLHTNGSKYICIYNNMWVNYVFYCEIAQMRVLSLLKDWRKSMMLCVHMMLLEWCATNIPWIWLHVLVGDMIKKINYWWAAKWRYII